MKPTKEHLAKVIHTVCPPKADHVRRFLHSTLATYACLALSELPVQGWSSVGWISIISALGVMIPEGSIGGSLHKAKARIGGVLFGFLVSFVGMVVVTAGFTVWNGVHETDAEYARTGDLQQPPEVVYITTFVLVPVLYLLCSAIGYAQNVTNTYRYLFTVYSQITVVLSIFPSMISNSFVYTTLQRVCAELIGVIVGVVAVHFWPKSENDCYFNEIVEILECFEEMIEPLVLFEGTGAVCQFSKEEWLLMKRKLIRCEKLLEAAQHTIRTSKNECTICFRGHPAYLSTNVKLRILERLSKSVDILALFLYTVDAVMTSTQKTPTVENSEGSSRQQTTSLSEADNEQALSGKLQGDTRCLSGDAYLSYNEIFGSDLRAITQEMTKALRVLSEALRNRSLEKFMHQCWMHLSLCAQHLCSLHYTLRKRQQEFGVNLQLFSERAEKELSIGPRTQAAILRNNLLVPHEPLSAEEPQIIEGQKLTILQLMSQLFLVDLIRERNSEEEVRIWSQVFILQYKLAICDKLLVSFFVATKELVHDLGELLEEYSRDQCFHR